MAVHTTPEDLEARFQSGGELRFDVIRSRATEKLGITNGEATLQEMADLFGLSLKQVWRFSNGLAMPSVATALLIGELLGLKVEEFTQPKAGEPA